MGPEETGVFLIIIPTNALISQIYFWNKTLHVSESSSVHHQEFCTVNTAMVYIMCGIRMHAEAVFQPASGYHTTPAKPHRNTNTHRTRAIQPVK